MNSSVLQELDWENCFEKATEDISSFEWMLAGFIEDPLQNLNSYRLIEALSDRSRGFRALLLMNSGLLPASYHSYREKLQAMLQNNDVQFQAFLENQWEEIRPFFREGGGVWKQTKNLEQTWNSLEKVFQEWFVFHDESDQPDEYLRDQAMDFLLPFADMFRAAYDSPEWLEQQPEFQTWKKTFIQVEKRFQDGFGYLEPLADTLEVIYHREYDTEFWWLKTRPSVDTVVQTQWIPERLTKAQQEVVDESHASCPDSALVISYAFHELPDSELRHIRQHVRTCGACLKLVLDLRAAAGQQDNSPAIPWDQYLAELPKPIKIREFLSQPALSGIVRNVMTRFQEKIEWPASLPDSPTLLEVFFQAVFRRDVLPLMASDITEESLLGKLITIDADLYIQSILPLPIIVHRLEHNTETIVVSMELPDQLQDGSGLDFYFGWEMPNNQVLDLETLELAQRKAFVAAKLGKPFSKKLEGRLHVVIIRSVDSL